MRRVAVRSPAASTIVSKTRRYASELGDVVCTALGVTDSGKLYNTVLRVQWRVRHNEYKVKEDGGGQDTSCE